MIVPWNQCKDKKYLGVVFDCTLSWTYHVSQVCKNMSYYLYLIGRHNHCLDVGLIKLLLDALVLSHLCYCLPVWGLALSQQSLHWLERIQNWALRMTMGLSRFDHVSQQLDWLPVKMLIQFQSCCLMFRQYHLFLCHLWSRMVVAILMTPGLAIILRILREYTLHLLINFSGRKIKSQMPLPQIKFAQHQVANCWSLIVWRLWLKHKGKHVFMVVDNLITSVRIDCLQEHQLTLNFSCILDMMIKTPAKAAASDILSQS